MSMRTLPDTGLRHGDGQRTTQAAEGMLRRRFSVAEIDAMSEAGILEEDERLELIGGELVPMCPKGNHHEVLKHALLHYWAKRVPPPLTFTTETTFRVTPDTFLEPDFVFYDKVTGIRGLNGDTAKLVVEIADSSYGYDTGRKAGLYAMFGIVELWVIHAVTFQTRIHRKPSLTGYRAAADFPGEQELVPLCADELAVTLSTLELY